MLFFLLAPNVCAHDVPPRWAFVRWLLRRHVRERGVRRWLFFIFLSSSKQFFLFFIVVKTAFLLMFSFIPPLSIFANFDYFLSIIARNLVKLILNTDKVCFSILLKTTLICQLLFILLLTIFFSSNEIAQITYN